jgi:hypothetical protein
LYHSGNLRRHVREAERFERREHEQRTVWWTPDAPSGATGITRQCGKIPSGD